MSRKDSTVHSSEPLSPKSSRRRSSHYVFVEVPRRHPSVSVPKQSSILSILLHPLTWPVYIVVLALFNAPLALVVFTVAVFASPFAIIWHIGIGNLSHAVWDSIVQGVKDVFVRAALKVLRIVYIASVWLLVGVAFVLLFVPPKQV
jgi:hypothetical protein